MFKLTLILTTLLTLTVGCDTHNAEAAPLTQDDESWDPSGVYQGYVSGYSDLEYAVLVHDGEDLTFTWPRTPCVFPFELVHADADMLVYESVEHQCQHDAPGERPVETDLVAGTITVTSDGLLDITWTTSEESISTTRSFSTF